MEIEEESKKDEEEFIRTEFKSVEQISDELITLSLLPNSRWQNLLHLDVIKVHTITLFLVCQRIFTIQILRN